MMMRILNYISVFVLIVSYYVWFIYLKFQFSSDKLEYVHIRFSKKLIQILSHVTYFNPQLTFLREELISIIKLQEDCNCYFLCLHGWLSVYVCSLTLPLTAQQTV